MITTDRISRALGDAVVRVWGRLPHDLQSQLFDEVVAENEEMKQALHCIRPNLPMNRALQ